MNEKEIKKLLEGIKNNEVSVEQGLKELKDLPFKDLEFVKIDNHRELRVGYPEVIYCGGKTTKQVVDIIESMMEKKNNILATRANEEMYFGIKKIYEKAEYFKQANIVRIMNKKVEESESYIAVVTGGTSDIPVAEEAAITAETFGNKVCRIYDVGVSGIHRLFNRLEKIRKAKVVIVVAGMEGALASVIGGLVDKPVIAVPTSIGYGANFNGLSALLSMLNSCSSGVSVVNIDNGFGAGYNASIINRI
ncbi:nickel pincer cofactor biosynthesis protein LarB [Clostridium rectalis]|uniref:nickel pincer cofactor biosynthesis protein LarB n=1 Tax=Clostridium rectalis TaxID=2040295 RepID=UPI000F638F2B|nr:nickel pincer cofactor biosynthesis protein LarB [Clostridium rectalis]